MNTTIETISTTFNLETAFVIALRTLNEVEEARGSELVSLPELSLLIGESSRHGFVKSALHD